MPLKHLTEYRDPDLARRLIAAIRARSKKPIRLMEVCGTHTVSVFRHGIRQVLPEHIQLISGPGCPVCVTAIGDIDRAIKVARLPGVIVATFGDMIRVPGSRSSLQAEKAEGADVRLVYSVFDVLSLAREYPGKEVVFLGIGFETTAPTVAATVLEAAGREFKNVSVLSLHKLLPPALEALLRAGDADIQGFIYPGHVSTVIGTSAYEALARKYGLPGVVSGFEPVDILESIFLLVEMIEEGRAEVSIQYRRGVIPQGNPRAVELMYRVFEKADAPWRGLGTITGSGLVFRESYRAFAAEERFDLSIPPPSEHPGCACGEILRGVKSPPACPLFRRLCRPDHPLGPCMVSTEGTCGAYFRFGQ